MVGKIVKHHEHRHVLDGHEGNALEVAQAVKLLGQFVGSGKDHEDQRDRCGDRGNQNVFFKWEISRENESDPEEIGKGERGHNQKPVHGDLQNFEFDEVSVHPSKDKNILMLRIKIAPPIFLSGHGIQQIGGVTVPRK